MPYQKQIDELKKQHALEIKKLRENYEQRIRNFDQILLTAIKDEEKRVKSAWTWKAGRIVVAPLVVMKEIFDKLFPANEIPEYRAEKQEVINDVGKTIEKQPVSVEIEGIVDSPLLIDPQNIIVGAVLDTFTYNCFKYEFNIVRPNLGQWKEVFNQQPIQALMIESAWKGNEGTWARQIGSSSYNDKVSLNSMLDWSRNLAVPTIFWNKEDPVHFDFFLKDAIKFDYIFTTDEGIIPKYVEAAGHKNVFALPFAAQHAIHNPVLDEPRDKNICFAGTYYNRRYVERKGDMDILLKPSLDFGLEIFDRNYGSTGEDAENYRFPDIYQPVIKGRLEYDEMVKAYKRYKVFLNVNSVRNSSTMFARRVFELLACGTPVISSYTKGIISLLGEGTVFITEREEDTRIHLEKLLNDQHFWWKSSLHGMRTVLERHSYSDRTEDIFRITGLPFTRRKKPAILIISVVRDDNQMHYLSELAAKQSVAPAGIVFLVDGEKKVQAMKQRSERFGGSVRSLVLNLDGGKFKPILKEHFTFSHVAFMNPSAYYGKNYLRDFRLAIEYSGAEAIGKAEGIRLNERGEILVIPNREYQYVSAVLPEALVISNQLFEKTEIASVCGQKEYRMPGNKLLSIDPFNFLPEGHQLYKTHRKKMEANIDI